VTLAASEWIDNGAQFFIGQKNRGKNLTS